MNLTLCMRPLRCGIPAQAQRLSMPGVIPKWHPNSDLNRTRVGTPGSNNLHKHGEEGTQTHTVLVSLPSACDLWAMASRQRHSASPCPGGMPKRSFNSDLVREGEAWLLRTHTTLVSLELESSFCSPPPHRSGQFKQQINQNHLRSARKSL